MLDASGYTTENRYPALRVISVVFKVLAVLAAVFGLIGALVGVVQMAGDATGGLLALVSLLYGGLLCIYMFAASEAIRVFIDVESNTRLTNDLLRRLLEK
jgi:hypothetical protein